MFSSGIICDGSHWSAGVSYDDFRHLFGPSIDAASIIPVTDRLPKLHRSANAPKLKKLGGSLGSCCKLSQPMLKDIFLSTLGYLF